MRILVTGGAGFIGSHVVDALIDDGHEVAIVDNMSRGREDNVNPKAALHRADIRDADALRRVFEEFKPEIVNHHAAHIDLRKSVEDPAFDAEANILGTLNLLALSVENKCRRFVFISSGGAVYGIPKRLPVDEGHPIKPVSPYGASKYSAECYVDMYHRIYDLETVILRYSNVYGPRQDPKGEAGVVAIFAGLMLNNKPATIFGDGTKTRDYAYVGDLVKANMAAMLREGAQGCFNLGTGVETSDMQIFEAVREAAGADVEPIFSEMRPGEVYRICLDCSLAEKGLGWRANTPLKDGIAKAVDYYRQRM